MADEGYVQDRIQPRYKQVASRKKISLAINPDAQAEAAAASGAPVLTAGGSLRADDLSIGLAGLRVKSDTPDRRGFDMQGLAACAEAGSSSEGRFKAMPSSEDDEQVSLDEFRVLRELGEGTSGVVCLVRHKPTGRLYAKKVINLGCSDKERTQILMEIRTLHKSHVPGIIAFKNAFYADNAVHIVLEYMNCGSLASVVQRSGPLPEQLLARVTSDVLGGVDHLHRVLKVVHRDIKPANVLLNDNTEVKLADFGMSGQLANTFGRLASWVGTAAYMSPERISGASYSYESDIWALGVTLWECSVGRYPYVSAPGASERGGNGGSDERRRSAAAGDGSGGGGGAPSEGLLPGDEQKMGITFWDLLYSIVECDAPPLPSWESCGLIFSPQFKELVHSCMHKDGTRRPAAASLLSHPWLHESRRKPQPNLSEWLVPDEVDSQPT